MCRVVCMNREMKSTGVGGNEVLYDRGSFGDEGRV